MDAAIFEHYLDSKQLFRTLAVERIYLLGVKMVDRDRRHFFTKCLARQIGKIVQGFEAGVAEARRKEEFDKFFSSYESSYALTLAYPDDILIETAQRTGIAIEGRDKNDIVKELFVKKGGDYD